MTIIRIITLLGILSITAAQMLRGVNWGHRIGQTWDDSKDCKPAARIEAEFAKMATYAQAVKIYSCGECLAGPQTLKYAKQFKLKVFLGLTADPKWFPGDFQVLKDMDAQYGLNDVLGISVGTEDLYRNDVPGLNASTIVDQIKQVQAFARSKGYSFPVTHVDAIGARDPRWGDIRSVQDIYMYNYFPFWMGVHVNGALPTTIGAFEDIKANFAQGKPVWIGEVGWPSGGYNKGEAVADEATAGKYLRDFICWANSAGVPYFYYEMFDEPWKNPAVGPTGPIEANFGIFNADMSAKSYSAFTCDGSTPVDPIPQPTTKAPTPTTSADLPAPTTSSAAPVATSATEVANPTGVAQPTSSTTIVVPLTTAADPNPLPTTNAEQITSTFNRQQGSASTLALSVVSVVALALLF